jgi:hypothetical protein
MSRILILSILFVVTASMAFPLWGQQEVPAAPVPPQISSAKKVFISNLGTDSFYTADHNWYSGGPNRAYNQFYEAMKTWGRYDLVSVPADADLVVEISCQDSTAQGPTQLRLRIVDPKTQVALWGVTEHLEAAGMAKNREKNFNLAMTALLNDVKQLVSPLPQPAQK